MEINLKHFYSIVFAKQNQVVPDHTFSNGHDACGNSQNIHHLSPKP